MLSYSRRYFRNPLMTKTPEELVYHCECGQKLAFTTKGNATSKCSCGRTIVVKYGFAYSPGKD
jgi:hypothetical protein